MGQVSSEKGGPRRQGPAIGLTLVLAVALMAVLEVAPAARATIQEESCIYPDVEYPLPCDDED